MSDYNYIYKKLVQSPNDVVGALAYGLYKEEKIAYLTEFKTANNRDPEDADLLEFHRLTNLQQRIDAYKLQAEGLLQEFLDDVLAEQLLVQEQQLQSELLSKKVDHLTTLVTTRANDLRDEVQRKQKFWVGVRQNIVAGLATTLLTFGFVLAAWMWAEGPTKILKGAWDRYNSSPPSAAEPTAPSKQTEPPAP